MPVSKSDIDEFGIPVKKASSPLDEFGIPIKANPDAALKLSDFKSETQTQQPNLDFNALKVKAQKIQPSIEETRDAADVTERMNEQVTKRNTAIENTLERKYKNLGTNVKKNSPQYKKDYNDLLQKQMNGDVVISEARDGKPFVIRGAGFLESAGNTLIESFKTPIEADKTMNLDGKELADYLDKKQAETPYLEESAPSGFGGALGEAAGGFPKVGGLMAINYAVPYLGTAAATAEAELSSSWVHTQDLYQRNLKALTDSGVPFEQARVQAAHKAKQDAPIAALPDAVMTAALGEMGANTGAMAKSANNFKTTLLKSGKSIGTFAALGGTSEVARSGIEKAQGYDVNMQQVLDNFGKGAFQWATMDAMLKIAPILSSMPRSSQASWKDYMSNVPKEVRQTLGEEVNKEINGYAEAKKEVPDYYSDEHKTVLADLVQQKNNLEEQKTKHPSFKDDFDEQIATLDGTINAVKHSKDPSSIHVDELTGETHGNHKEFDKLTSQEKNGVVVPKEYGAAETEQVGKDEEKRFKPVAYATDKQGALEIKKPIEIESDKTYTDKAKAQEVADRALAQHYYENGLPDNQKPQKHERANTTTEENKQKENEVIQPETDATTNEPNVTAEEAQPTTAEPNQVGEGTSEPKQTLLEDNNIVGDGFEQKVKDIQDLHKELDKKTKKKDFSRDEAQALEDNQYAKIDELQSAIKKFKEDAKRKGISAYDNNKILESVNNDIANVERELSEAKEKLQGYKQNDSRVGSSANPEGNYKISDINRKRKEAKIKEINIRLQDLNSIKRIVEKNISSKDIVGDISGKFNTAFGRSSFTPKDVAATTDYIQNKSGENFSKGHDASKLSTEFLNTKEQLRDNNIVEQPKELTDLQQRHADELHEAGKPVIDMARISNKDFAKMDDPAKIKATKEKHTDIFRRKKILEKLIDCL